LVINYLDNTSLAALGTTKTQRSYV